MVEYINKAELKQAVRNKYKDIETRIEVNCIVNEMPTIDIVTCKECKYAEPRECFDVARQETILGVVCKNALFHYADWFCADGERR